MALWRGGMGRVWRAALCMVALLLALPLVAWAMLHHEGSTAWLVSRLPHWVPGLVVQGAQGTVMGDFRAERVVLPLPRGGRLELVQPAWQGLRLARDPEAPWGWGFTAARVQAQRLQVQWVPGPPQPAQDLPEPEGLQWPAGLSVHSLQVDAVHAPWWDGPVALQLGWRSEARGHRLQALRLMWQGWRVHAAGTMGAERPWPVDAQLQAVQEAAGGKVAAGQTVKVQLRGPLSRLLLALQARGQAGVASADASAVLQPLRAWPVQQLRLQARGLDLSVWHAQAPGTAMDLDLNVGEPTRPAGAAGWQQVAAIALRNAADGAWDGGRLPVQALQGALRWPLGSDAQRAAGRATPLWSATSADLQVRLSGDGRLGLQGRWDDAEGWQLRWSDLSLQALHGGAPSVRWQGEARLLPEQRDKLEGPWRLVAQARGRGVSPLRAAPGLGVRSQPGQAFDRVGGLALSLKARWEGTAVQIERLQLVSDGGEALVQQALLDWQTGPGLAAWRSRGQLALRGLNPAAWLPWPAAVPAVNRLTGQGQWALDAQGLGQAEWRLEPSVLAGLPLSGEARWRKASAAALAEFNVRLDVAGQALQADARLPWPLHSAQAAAQAPAQAPAQERQSRWRVAVHAGRLQALQPLAPLLGGRSLQGSVALQAGAEGGLSALRTHGELRAEGVRWQAEAGDAVALAHAEGQWQLAEGMPWRGQLALRGMSVGAARLGQADLAITGQAAAHVLSIEALGAWQPEASLAPSAGQGGEVASRSVAPWQGRPVRLSLGLTGAAEGVSQGWPPRAWRGQLTRLLLKLDAPSDQDLPPLLQWAPVALAWQQGDGGQWRGTAAPSQGELMGVPIGLERLAVSAPGAASQQASPPQPGGAWLWDMALTMPQLSVSPLLRRWQPQAGWAGDLSVGGRLAWQGGAGRPWQVDAELSRVAGDLWLEDALVQGGTPTRLGLKEARLQVQAREGRWWARQALEGRLLGQLRGQQSLLAANAMALPDASSPLQGEVQLHVANLRALGTWLPAGWRLAGRVQSQLSLGGTLGRPSLRGSAEGQQIGLSQALLGVHVQDGSLKLDFDPQGVRLTRLEAGDGRSGRLSGQGELVVAPAAGGPTSLSLNLQAQRFALLQRVDRRVVVSGQATASLLDMVAQVRGQVRVDEGLIDISRADAPTIGDDVFVRNRPGLPDDDGVRRPAGGAVAFAANGQDPTLRADVDLGLDLGDHLRIRGHGLDGLLVGRLQVLTPNSKPALQGAVRLERGHYAAYGQKLVIERGAVTFGGPIENPRLDILAMRPQSPAASDEDVKVGVRITGTALEPRVRLYSEPSLSETEQLSWLVLGRGPSGLGGADIGLLQTAAVALLSGEGSQAPTDRLMGLLGLDNVSVRQTDGAVRDTVVNVGKQVSKLWYVGYERNLNATGGNWQLIYRLARRFQVRAQAGEDNALDLIWQWRWN